MNVPVTLNAMAIGAAGLGAVIEGSWWAGGTFMLVIAALVAASDDLLPSLTDVWRKRLGYAVAGLVAAAFVAAGLGIGFEHSVACGLFIVLSGTGFIAFLYERRAARRVVS
jgi:hypothetical protein